MARSLTESALEAVRTGSFESFAMALQGESLATSFGILMSREISEMLTRDLSTDDVAKWVLRRPTWDGTYYLAGRDLRPGEELLHLLWQDLERRLVGKLRAAFQTVPMSSRGAVLCFFGPAAMSAIVAYERRGDAVSLRPIAAQQSPAGVFELPHLLTGATPAQRNAIKAAALSVDKLVFQRGVLGHVNRHGEEVCGPTIDTIILAELLAEWLDCRGEAAEVTALEVGPGSGLLSTILGAAENVRRIVAVDLNPAAAVCTLKNLAINGLRLDAKRPRISIRAEHFVPGELADDMDLIVCNPPYIPDPPPAGSGDLGGYHRSVAGLELNAALLGALDQLLSPDGQALLMTSSVSVAQVMEAVPEGFHASPVLPGRGRRVPLDVDVVWERDDWQALLVSNGLIEADADGNLWHYLQPFWISRVLRDSHG